MGGVLGNVIRLCNERNITPVFVHHFKRTRANADPHAPGELIDLTQAGAAEIAGQWWLLTRRENYNPDRPGEHRLWLSVGGRVGNSSLHALDIYEGSRDDPGGRRWEVEVRKPDEIRGEKTDRRDQDKASKKAEELEADRNEIVRVVVKAGNPETKTALRERVGCSHRRFDCAFASLLDDGTLHAIPIKKGNRQDYTGYTTTHNSDG
jgi:hypothetical protein